MCIEIQSTNLKFTARLFRAPDRKRNKDNSVMYFLISTKTCYDPSPELSRSVKLLEHFFQHHSPRQTKQHGIRQQEGHGAS